jgi:hypothetical protein
MKKIILILIVLTAVLEGCKKYEEGPWLSFRSAEKRIYGIYRLTQYDVNNIDSLVLFNDSLCDTLQFYHSEDSNTNVLKIDGRQNDGGKIYFDGTWKLSNNDKIFILYSFAAYSHGIVHSATGPFSYFTTTEWEILRLTNKEVKMKTIFNSKEYLIKLEVLN